MNYGERLKFMRESKGITQLDIAKLLNTTQNQISKYETDTQKMSIERYAILAKFYGVSVDYLLGLSDS